MDEKTSTEFICGCDRYTGWISKGDRLTCPCCGTIYTGGEVQTPNGTISIVGWCDRPPARPCDVFIKFKNGKVEKAKVGLLIDVHIREIRVKYGWWPFYRKAPKNCRWGLV